MIGSGIRRCWLVLGLCLFLAGCGGSISIPTPTVELPTATIEIPTSELPTSTLPVKPTPTPTLTPGPISLENQFAFEQAARLGRGVNLGNALEAPNEGEWGVVLEEGYFDLIKQAGFDTVRVPIRWNAHALEKPPYTIDADFFARVDWVVDQALARNLNVILNIHHYNELMEEPRPHKERFLALWEQIADHYRQAPDSVYFELLNEPNNTLSALYWNDYAQEAIRTIRRTNARRTIIVGPGDWNSLWKLNELQLPEEDRNLIVTFHYYEPFQFTHQGAEWVENSTPWLGTKWSDDEASIGKIRRDFDIVKQWSEKNQRPIFLGEFGAYSKADDTSRHLWTNAVARAAEERGFSWAYWEFCAGFGVYNREKQSWNEPILTALIP